MKIFAIHNVNHPRAGPGKSKPWSPAENNDLTRASVEHVVVLMTLGTAEGAITIVAVCMPVLRTLLMQESNHLLKSSLLNHVP